MTKRKPPQPRRAGLRDDELESNESSDVVQKGDEATGSPAGGLGDTGIGGLPQGDGSPGNREQTEIEDTPNEPQASRSGSAVGGTPANKRTRGK